MKEEDFQHYPWVQELSLGFKREGEKERKDSTDVSLAEVHAQDQAAVAPTGPFLKGQALIAP